MSLYQFNSGSAVPEINIKQIRPAFGISRLADLNIRAGRGHDALKAAFILDVETVLSVEWTLEFTSEGEVLVGRNSVVISRDSQSLDESPLFTALKEDVRNAAILHIRRISSLHADLYRKASSTELLIPSDLSLSGDPSVEASPYSVEELSARIASRFAKLQALIKSTGILNPAYLKGGVESLDVAAVKLAERGITLTEDHRSAILLLPIINAWSSGSASSLLGSRAGEEDFDEGVEINATQLLGTTEPDPIRSEDEDD